MHEGPISTIQCLTINSQIGSSGVPTGSIEIGPIGQISARFWLYVITRDMSAGSPIISWGSIPHDKLVDLECRRPGQPCDSQHMMYGCCNNSCMVVPVSTPDNSFPFCRMRESNCLLMKIHSAAWRGGRFADTLVFSPVRVPDASIILTL